MKLASRLALATLAVALLASCSTPPPPPLPVVVVPPAAPPPPPVAMTSQTLEAAAYYRAYMRRAADISPAFADGQAVEQSLVSGLSYEPAQFLRGMVAYAALVALQNPQFVAGVRTYAVDPEGRHALAAKLIADPSYAAALPSAAGAAGMIAAAIAADGAKVHHAGDLVHQAAYDVQHQPWSLGEVAGRDARLANAKAVSAQRATPPAEDVQVLTTAVNGPDASGMGPLNITADPKDPPYTPIIARGLALAALAALGEAQTTDGSALDQMMDDKTSDFCINMSKLNVYQCLSVAKPYYEDVFCLGQHVLLDTAQCVEKAAGVIQVASSAPPPAASAPAKAPPKAKAKKRPAAKKRAAKKS